MIKKKLREKIEWRDQVEKDDGHIVQLPFRHSSFQGLTAFGIFSPYPMQRIINLIQMYINCVGGKKS